MGYLACPGKFCRASCAPPKVAHMIQNFEKFWWNSSILGVISWDFAHGRPCWELRLWSESLKWLVETENAFSSRRVIFYSTRPGQIERQNGYELFIWKFRKIGHNFWSNLWNLLRIVQNTAEAYSFRMRYLPCPRQFCGESSAPTKVSWHDQLFQNFDETHQFWASFHEILHMGGPAGSFACAVRVLNGL